MSALENVEIVTFDCYGTLIDWETGLLAVLRPWARARGLAADDRALLAAFSEAEPRCQAARPDARYPEILRAVHAEIARAFGVIQQTRRVTHQPVFVLLDHRMQPSRIVRGTVSFGHRVWFLEKQLRPV